MVALTLVLLASTPATETRYPHWVAGFRYAEGMDDNTADHLISVEYLQSSLTDSARFDLGLAHWAIDVVSNTARLIASQPGWDYESVPPAVQTVVSLAARRLYTNPDRFTREASSDYSYGLDPSVTNADVFTPTEIGTLRQYAPGRRSGSLRTLSTTRGDGGYPVDGYVPDGTRYGFPWYATGDTPLFERGL